MSLAGPLCQTRHPELAFRRLSLTRFFRERLFERSRANADAEATVREIFKFNVMFAPDFLERANRRAPRLGFALLKLVDRPLSHSDAEPEFTLAPAQHRARNSDLGSKGMAFELEELSEIARLPCNLNRHLSKHCVPLRRAPGGFPPGATFKHP